MLISTIQEYAFFIYSFLIFSNQVNNVCKKCGHRRAERKEIITEIVETEVKYGKDLRIIVEEFYRPMLVAGLLTSELLATIFLNVDELIQVNNKFAKMLKDAVNSTLEQGEEDFQSIRIGAIFLESIGMLRAFESYCTRQVKTINKSILQNTICV